MSLVVTSPSPVPLPCVRGKIVIASDDARLMNALVAMSRRSGFEPYVVSDATAAIAATKEHLPDCLWLDAGVRGLDVGKVVRILQRFGPTRCSVPILIAPESITPLRLNQMMSLGAAAVIERPFHAHHLAETFHAALARSSDLKSHYEAPALRSVSPTRRVESNSSLLQRRVGCPFHDKPVPFERYILRTGKILTDISPFDLPVYKSPMSGMDFVNFHLLNIAVCPTCFFATNNPAYLIDPGADPHEHTPATRKAIIDGAPARAAMAAKVGPDFFNEHRTAADAIVAHQLAIRCGETIFACNKSSLPFELLRLGNYHLRLAHLYELENPADERREANLTQALEWLKQGFTVLDPPALFKATYQIIAIAIALGDDRGAYPYLTRMKEMRTEPMQDPTHASMLDRYAGRAINVWENRDYNRLPSVQARLDAEKAA